MQRVETGTARALPIFVQHPTVASQSSFAILPFAPVMKKFGLLLIAGFFFCTSPWLNAQSDDPSETFLKAYMTAQQGEKLEHDNEFKAALAKYRFAGDRLKPLVELGPSFRLPEGQSTFAKYGVTAGLGFETGMRKLKIAPVFRYTRWGAEKLPEFTYGIRNQLEFLTGFSF